MSVDAAAARQHQHRADLPLAAAVVAVGCAPPGPGVAADLDPGELACVGHALQQGRGLDDGGSPPGKIVQAVASGSSWTKPQAVSRAARGRRQMRQSQDHPRPRSAAPGDVRLARPSKRANSMESGLWRQGFRSAATPRSASVSGEIAGGGSSCASAGKPNSTTMPFGIEMSEVNGENTDRGESARRLGVLGFGHRPSPRPRPGRERRDNLRSRDCDRAAPEGWPYFGFVRRRAGRPRLSASREPARRPERPADPRTAAAV